MRKLKTLAICLAVILLAIVSVELPSGVRYNAQLAAVRASGGPATVDELMGPPIPDSRNAALIYERVLSQRPAQTVDADYQTLCHVLESATPTHIAAARAALDRNRDLIEMAELAASRPYCRYKVDWSLGVHSDGDFEFPYFREVGILEILCRAAAIVNAKDGNTDEAVRMLALSHKVCESLKDEPCLSAQRCRMFYLGAQSEALRMIAKGGRINYGQAKTLFNLLAATDVRQGYIRGLQGDRGILLAARNRMSTFRFVDSYYPGCSRGRPGIPVNAAIYCTIADADLALYLSIMSQQIELCKMTYRQAVATGTLDNYPELPSYAVLTRMIFHDRYQTAGRCFESRCLLAGDQVFLALLAYKARFGSYPKTYADLQFRLGWKLPNDPFSESPFHYKPSGEGFILRSVGLDPKDTGGTSRRQANQTPAEVWTMGR